MRKVVVHLHRPLPYHTMTVHGCATVDATCGYGYYTLRLFRPISFSSVQFTHTDRYKRVLLDFVHCV